MIKLGVLRVKTMKSISHPQVTVLEIKPVFRSLHYTIQFDGWFFFFFFFSTAITIFLPFVPFLNCRSEQNYVPKAIEKNVARYEPENLRLLHLFQVFKPKKTEFRDRKIVLNTGRYLSIKQSQSGPLYLEKELVCIPRK